MAVRITVDLRELADLPRRVSTVLEAARLTRLQQEAAAVSLRQHQQRFARRVSPDGERWPPRKDSKPHPLLEETGRMRRSIRAVPKRDDVVVTASTPYAAVHQFGAGPIPQRQFLGFGAADVAELATTAEQWLGRHVGEVLR